MTFQRSKEIRFNFGGMNTNTPVDALAPNKYPFAINIRGMMGQSIRTRPGYTQLFGIGGPVTDLRAYATLNTDNNPRVLARRSNNHIYLDNGIDVGTLAGSAQGACMIPYRPNQSPQSWMYVGVPNDYQKFSAPDALNNVIQYKVGIREPQMQPEASPLSLNYHDFTGLAAAWTPGGTAGATANATRVADTAVAAFPDPASNSTRWSVQVAINKSYQAGMLIDIGAFHTIVEDVYPPIGTGTAIKIQSIFYYTGTTGRCVIVPTQIPGGSLARGALIKLSTGPETCLVLSVTVGSDGTMSIETSTTGAHVAGETITGIPAICVSDIDVSVVGGAISSADVTSTLTGVGTGTLTQALGTNPFIQVLSPSGTIAQLDDYICLGFQINNVSRLVQGTVTFDIKNGAPDYVTDTLYTTFDISNMIFSNPINVGALEMTPEQQATIQNLIGTLPPTPPTLPALPEGIPSSYLPMAIPPEQWAQYQAALEYQTQAQNVQQEITGIITSLTPLPTSPWATLMIPIRSLIRVGNDNSRSLANCQAVRISIQTTDTVNIAISSFCIVGGGQPDVSNNAPYQYCFRGRNTLTGAKGNPSPKTRYGVSPRRQPVRVEMTDTISDIQADIFDVYRFGGTVTSWRRVGSVVNSGAPVVFVDNNFDSAALGGDLAEFDNFEPWPSIDLPYVATAGVVAGVTTTIQLVGTKLVVIYSSFGAFTNPAPSNILRWLPGTFIQLSGGSTYTLRSRPTAITLAAPPAANYYAYRFELVENAGVTVPTSVQILEPKLANQHLPYIWGPNAQGDLFGCGDTYRPGTVSFIKEHDPDSAPDKYNLEITPPSEPLLGGMVLGGSSIVGSSKRWWAMNPAFDTPQRYYVLERQIGRGLLTPYGHCTDGMRGYFWAKDGIWTTDGSEGGSLTDTDLYNLFPHEGVAGQNVVYHGVTVYAPDYKRASTFRLGTCNGFLYADYQDSTGTPRTLVYDIDLKAWCVDEYVDVGTVHYGVEQQNGTLLTPATLYPVLIQGFNNGVIGRQIDNTNDNGVAITCDLATLEFNGGDARADMLWGDVWIDSIPINGLTATPVSSGAGLVAATAISASASRGRTVIAINAPSKFAGVHLNWTDNFPGSSTVLYLWQPMFEVLPVSLKVWKPEGMGFGIKGYKSIWKIHAAYRSNDPVTLTITAYDGTSPAVITLPSTGGAYQKNLFLLTPNKGHLYFFTASCPSLWTPYLDEWEIHVAAWGRQSECIVAKDLSIPMGVS